MEWWRRATFGLIPQKKKELPEGVWIKCDNCKESLYYKDLDNNNYVCTRCDYHFKIPSDKYISYLVDEKSFYEIDADMKSSDPLKFKDRKKYKDRLKSAMSKTGLNEAIQTGVGRIDNMPVVIGVMDFRFIGGSMGSVVGEKVKRAIEKAMELEVPLIIVSASGGARMMEGILSLMQMAKTSAKLAEFNRKNGLYISVLTNPTTAGVMASYASLGDVIIAEPDALVGFAGPRVIKQTIGEDLPKGFQRSEFLMEHGFIDIVVNRKEMKNTIARLIKFFKDDKIEEKEKKDTSY